MSKSKHKAKKKYRNNGAPSGPRPRPAARAAASGARRFVPPRRAIRLTSGPPSPRSPARRRECGALGWW
ncbi:MAG: hypothetical protein HS111_08520 [Kofleriaceae bacterium]|nr:hypothetical protein [Kofleriaceae bacterium]